MQTEGERQALRDCGVDESRLVLQGMGIVPEECTGGQRERTRQSWGFGPDDVVVGHLANLSEEKGSVDLLRASERARNDESPPAFHLVLAGATMPSFLRYWKRHRAPGVRLLGELSDVAKRDFFAAIDVFALPSRVDSFGLVLLEAWANGVPVIGYRAGGIPWVIRDDVDGLVVPCGDVQGLAHAMVRLAANPELRNQLGLVGKKRVHGELHWNRSSEIVGRVYADVNTKP